MGIASKRSSNGLLLSAKLLGIGYLVFAALMLLGGAFRLIWFVNLVSRQHQPLDPDIAHSLCDHGDYLPVAGPALSRC